MKKLKLLLAILITIQSCISMEIPKTEKVELPSPEKKPASFSTLTPELQIEIVKNLVPEQITDRSFKTFIKEFESLSQINTYFNNFLNRISGTLAGLIANKLPLELAVVSQEGNKNPREKRTVETVLKTIEEYSENALGGSALDALMDELSKNIKYRKQLIREFSDLSSAKSPRTIERLLTLITKNGSFSGSTLEYLIGRTIERDINNDEKLHLLLKYGSAVDRAGFLIEAINNDNYKAIDLLADPDTINEKDDKGQTPIFTLLPTDENIPLLKYLINKGADITVKDDAGETLLSSSILYNLQNKISIDQYIKLINFLVQKGLDINSQNQFGETPLMYAVALNDLLLMNNILHLGANSSLKDNFGRTALYQAVEKGPVGIKLTERLLETYKAETDVNTPTNDGSTPLISATISGHNDIVNLLLEARAAVDLTNETDTTALIFAASFGHNDIIISLLDRGANINHANKDGITALISATIYGHNNTAALLLGKGALIDHQDNLGRTALLIAAADKNLDLVQLLLERGANASLPDKEGKTILDYLEPAE
jgi:ankyrin repeat protein